MTHAQLTVELVQQALARSGRPPEKRGHKSVTPKVRDAKAGDLEAVKQAIESWSGFPEEEADFALKLFGESLEGGPYRALVVEQEGQVLGGACFGKAPRTDETFNLHWIGVAWDCQGQGLGWKLLQAAESRVQAAGGTVLVVEMSSQPAHSYARQFFLRQGFRLVGDLPDYYRESEGRLTYAKYLSVDRPEDEDQVRVMYH